MIDCVKSFFEVNEYAKCILSIVNCVCDSKNIRQLK